MHRSPSIEAEITRARNALVNLTNSRSMNELEENWKEFLSRVERIWYKSENHFGRSPKWNGWKGKYEQARKNDPLLSYVIHARGAEEHTVAEIAAHQPGSLAINPGPTGSLHIKRLQISPAGIVLDADRDAVLVFSPSRLVLLPVTNRGRLYTVPNSHLGRPIDHQDLPGISSLVLTFYERLVQETEAFLARAK